MPKLKTHSGAKKRFNLTKSGTVIPAVDFEHLEEVLVILKLKQTVTE